MHELVISTVYSKLLSAIRLPSFAGEGLPERMRSISFALLGLTAAAGLALVAIFAQPGFTLLSQAPLPDQPSAGQSIGAARKLPSGRALVALLPALPAQLPQAEGGAAPRPSAVEPSGSSGGDTENAPASSEAEAPAPAPTPVGSPGPSSGNGGGGAGNQAGSSPAPTAAPQQPTASPSTPPYSPPVSAPAPAPKPEATTSAPKPEPAPGPGNSSSPAAAAHASERGIEASASSGPPASAPAAAPPVAPEAPSSPGNGNGLAKGHDK